MKRGLLITLIILLFAAVSFAADSDVPLQPGDTALIDCAGDALSVVPESATRLRVECTGSAPTETPPPPTATPPPVSTAPYPGAPACTEHNDREFHLLWNDESGCHYDHEHGRPYPDWAAEIWGNYTDYTGYEIGYAWETPNENRDKHPGYNMDAYDFRSEGCEPSVTPGGINAWAAQVHGMANSMGQLARVHSFWAAAHLCNSDGPAGTIVSGGHLDFGQLHSPYKTNLVGSDVFPKAPEPWNIHQPPYVGLARDARSFETWNANTTRISRPFVDEHQLITLAFRINDPVGAWQVNGEFIEFGGNSSERHIYELNVTIPQELAGADGRVNFTGWTDVHGIIDTSCTQTGATCVPLVITDAVPGRYSVNANQAGWLGLREFYEGDVYFGDQPSGWIGPMN